MVRGAGLDGAELRRLLAAEELIRVSDSVRLLGQAAIASSDSTLVRAQDVQRMRDASDAYDRATLVVDIYRFGVPHAQVEVPRVR